MTLYAASVITLFVAGCAPTAQQHAQDVGSATDDAAVAFSACVKRVRNQPVYASLMAHTTDLDTGQPTMAQMTDETIPTPAEALLLAARYDETNMCRGDFLRALATARPDLVPVFEDSFTKREAIAVGLVERKFSWGEASKRSRIVANDMQQKIANANRQWVTDLAAHRSDASLRLAATSALVHWSTQQQLFDEINSR
jgi:hypothetical protein